MMLQNADKLDDQYENLQKKLMKKEKIINKCFFKGLKEFKKTKKEANSIFKELDASLKLNDVKKEDFNSILTESYHSTTDSDKNYSDHSPRILIAKRNKQKKLKSINLKIRNSLIIEVESKNVYNDLTRYYDEELESRKIREKEENSIEKSGNESSFVISLSVCGHRGKEKFIKSEEKETRKKEENSNCLVI